MHTFLTVMGEKTFDFLVRSKTVTMIPRRSPVSDQKSTGDDGSRDRALDQVIMVSKNAASSPKQEKQR